jgi:hypothetical protein
VSVQPTTSERPTTPSVVPAPSEASPSPSAQAAPSVQVRGVSVGAGAGALAATGLPAILLAALGLLAAITGVAILRSGRKRT